MADCDPRRMLLNGKFLAESVSDSADAEKTEIVEMLKSQEGQAEVSEHLGGSLGTVPPNIIHPALDHSYVYSADSLKYLNASDGIDDSRAAESSESVGEPTQSIGSLEDAAANDYLHSFPSDDVVMHSQVDQNVPFSSKELSCELPEDVYAPSMDEVQSRSEPEEDAGMPGSGTKSAPLGSVENPIQILQQGNAYRSTQVLTKQHLQQIAQVLQQQQLGKALQNGGKSVLYDQTTNTRIVYRVIYPSELQNKLKSEGERTSASMEPSMPRSRSYPKKKFMKRLSEDERGKNALSKEEREEKKKHRPRTRSGRISKPPSYMVKDYKRIHHLDFNEEAYDDSDGGYSDYHVSDEEKEKHAKQGALSDSSTAKKRNYSCVTCSKAYIGKGGLSRHYRLNPNHGSLPEGEDVSTQDENSNSSLASSVFSVPGTSSQSSVNVSVTKSDIETLLQQPSFAIQDFLAIKRKSKLKEILKNYRDEELVEAVLPRLLPSMSVWDMIAAKSRKENSQQIDIPSLFANFEVLLNQMKRIAKSSLSSSVMVNDSSKSVVHVTNGELARALSINTGTYFIRDGARSYQIDPHHSYSIKRMDLENSVGQNTRSLIPDDLPTSSKLRKLHALEASVIEEQIDSTLPDQILSDAQEVDSLELNLPSVEFDTPSDPSQILNSISENSDNQEFTSRAFLDCNSSIVLPSRLIQTAGNSTTVTPSSLSSGCLSAVDASEASRTHSFLTTTAVQPLDNVQLSEVPLLSSLQNFQTEVPVNPLHTYSPSAAVKLNNIVATAEHQIISANDRTLLAFDNSDKLASQTLPQDTATDMYSSSIQHTPSIDFSAQSPVSLLQPGSVADMSVVSGCLVNSSIDGLCTSNTSINRVMSIGNVSALDEPSPATYEPSDKCGNLNSVPFNVQSVKPADNASVIRQLILPGGQVVGGWSQVQNQPDVTFTEQLLQESLAPDNLVLIQNPDGSYQVPNDQIVPLETLQALLNGQAVVKTVEEPSQLL